MVAKITEPEDIHRPVYYNENKVAEGVAKCIGANGFLKGYGDLTIADKLQRFDKLHALNDAKYKTLHISLNFAPGEKLDEDMLRQIASDYMEQIGFGDHPYVVYEHTDAGHPHIHIVVSAIREDGSRKDFHNIAKNESETARKAIETKYKLVRAEDQAKEVKSDIKALNVQKLQYGKTETKRGITNVLDAVLKSYKYSSLAELNAVLSLYHVRADPGEPGGRIHRNEGLLYRMVDDHGANIGKPIKASSIYAKPTMEFLKKKFAENKVKIPADIKQVKRAIDWILTAPPSALQGFTDALKEEGIRTVLRQNKEGLIYGLTFVDTQRKSVLNGSHIGKEYTAKRLLEKLGLDQHLKPLDTAWKKASYTPFNKANTVQFPSFETTSNELSVAPREGVWDILMQSEDGHQKAPWELLVDKKKKKKPSNNL